MKALKILLIIVAAILAVVVLLGLTGPKEFRYERSTNIRAPQELVYKYVSSHAAMDKWSPWNEYDPNMTKALEGTDGTVGAKASWSGNDQVGVGSQTFTELVPNERVRAALVFTAPWQASNVVGFDLAASGDSTKITWSMEGENAFMARVMGVFMNMEAMVGKDFEKGLASVKALAEAEAVRLAEDAKWMRNGFRIQQVDRPAMRYVGKRSIVKWKDMTPEYFGKCYTTIGAALGAAKQQPAGPPSAMFWAWDEVKMQADMAVVMSTAATTPIPDLTTFDIPAGKMNMIEYRGGYSGSVLAHQALEDLAKESGVEDGMHLEEYIVGPGENPDSTQWVTNIFVLAKP
jgi:effector-binding domain-containing protein/uncharacterized protein YndB with AHSA1/START domain